MRKEICVIEDDADMRALIRAVLRVDPRLEIACEAETFDEAFAYLDQHSIDLIIVDHFIHGKTMGLQAAPLLRNGIPNVKILLFTSHDLRIEADRESTVDAYLQKNHLDQLLPTICQLLNL